MPEKTWPTVLIVDDDEGNLVLERRVVRSAGYRTETALGVLKGLEAIARLGRAGIALVLTDAQMPNEGSDADVGGDAIIRAAHEAGINEVIVVTGAHDDRRVRGVIDKANPLAVISKPINTRKLVFTIDTLLRP